MQLQELRNLVNQTKPQDFVDELLRRLAERGLMIENPDGRVRLTSEAVAVARKGRGISGIDMVGGVLALARHVGMSEIHEIDSDKRAKPQ